MNRLKLRHTGLDRRRRVWRQAMLAALGLLWLSLAWAVRPARAQAACGHVDFLVEGGAALDRAAICEAAQPWADDGIRLFVYLTDVDPGSEDAWFAQLDEVESAMGYRAGEIFDRSLLALEATSGSSASWAVTFTYGEALYDTPLDQDETAVTRLKNDMRQALQSGDATAAFVTGVSEGYSLNHPGASPLLIGAGVVAGLGVLGAGGYAAYRSVLLPAQRRRQRREELQAQLARLQERVANLLLALEQLIAGQQPEEATLFQVFEAYGGRHEPEMETAVRARIAASQQAFDAAFALRQQLLDADFQQAQSLEEQVRAWELLYLSLVGSDPRIRGLTEAELRDLLDPVVVLQREAQGSAVVAQLRDLSKQIQGMPLKVDMLLLEPDNVDQAGILGTLEEVETAIGDLMAAQAAAPERLDAARAARLSAEEEAASAAPFGMTPGTIFPGIDARIQTAADDITAGAHVRALRAAETILRDLEVVEDLIDAAAEHAARQAEVDAVLAEGYRPATLAADREELATDVAEIRAALQAGDYLAADDWIDELDADSQRLLAQTTTWRETHLFNQESIERIRERQAAVLALLEQEAAPAWQALQQYAAGNWEDVAPDLAAQRAALQALTAETLPAIAQLNSLETQQFPEAERQLAAAGGRLLQTERALQAVGARLAAVRTAEETMPTALPQTQAELDRATALRDAEDAKIGPEVDAQLHQAAVQLAVAREAAEKQQWLAAATAQAEARRLALAAHTAADAQVQRVNRLQAELETARAAAEARLAAATGDVDALPAHVQTEEMGSRLRVLQAEVDEAQQAWLGLGGAQDAALASGLAAALAAYTAVATLADEAQAQAAADRQSYAAAQQEARAALQKARQQIDAAAAVCRQADAGGASRHALERARAALPADSAIEHSTRAQLADVVRQAQAAETAARDAQRSAEEAIRRARQQRGAMWTLAGGHSWGSPRSSRRSGSRGSHRPSSGWGGSSSRPRSSRPSSSSSSRRSSSSSSARRSSSSGGSRRSSSSGGSRRR